MTNLRGGGWRKFMRKLRGKSIWGRKCNGRDKDVHRLRERMGMRQREGGKEDGKKR